MIDAGTPGARRRWRIETVGRKMIPTPYDPFAGEDARRHRQPARHDRGPFHPDPPEVQAPWRHDRALPASGRRPQLAEVRERVAEWAATKGQSLAERMAGSAGHVLNDCAQDVSELLLALADLAWW